MDGHDIRKFKLEKPQKLHWKYPTNAILFSESIQDNIRLGKVNATDLEIQQASKTAAIHKSIKFKDGYKLFLVKEGLHYLEDKYRGYQLRGNNQRTKILLFDDCLSAVDTDTEEIILKNLGITAKIRQ